ncbi:hypothetical protein [Mycolicibacterium sp.]|uniref:hypothetical protein n=1 Tax=Mycolicibacterium sp. TaxID=2320850 RepID=UPI00355DDFE3
MSRRWRWVIAAVVAVVAVAAAAWLVVARTGGGNDCATAREMIAFNQQHNATVDAQANAGQESPQTGYEHWADHLSDLAGSIDDPELAEHAQRAAELAHQTVALNPALLDELSGPETSLGPTAHEYAELSRQFGEELTALGQACPA